MKITENYKSTYTLFTERGGRIDLLEDSKAQIYIPSTDKSYKRTLYPVSNGVKFYIDNARYTVTNTPFTLTAKATAPAILPDEIDLDPVPAQTESDGTYHEQYSTILACVTQNIPVYLTGPAGSGKNYTLEQVASSLNLDFYFTNSVQQEYKLTGFIDAGGEFHETEFYKAFTNGGLFFLDEMDASIPEVLVLLNAAIANRYFEFPNGRVTAHKNFRVVAAGNTVGSGADEQYTGRMVLDQATLDRFVVIHFDYDRNVELKLANQDEALVNFVRGLRRYAAENGIRATFSYRCISSTVALASSLPLVVILKIAIFKGMDQDTINTFTTDMSKDGSAGKYYHAMKTLQGAAA